MKLKVVHLTSETRRRVLRLYNALGELLFLDDSPEGLCSPSRFGLVRPSLYSMYSFLWGKDDSSLTKFVPFKRPPARPGVNVCSPPPCFREDPSLPF